MRSRMNTTGTGGPDEFECPSCDSNRIRTEWTEHRFNYGLGSDAIELRCQLPLRTCADCGNQFMDHVGETIRHDTVCRHLGVMTPAEVQASRERYEMTQAQFSQLTGIGEASQSRWETGASIQSKAFDNYLFLLAVPENVQRLKVRACGQDSLEGRPQLQQRFRSIEITDLRLIQQRSFLLRPAA
jgi:putative zinc finger/helix-turn-helix YgiT family protein